MVLSVAQARQQFAAAVTCTKASEVLSLLDCRGRVLAEDVVASVQVPPNDNSAMDGFAVNSAAVESGITLPVSQRIAAGDIGEPLAASTAARIFTGAPVPADADAVIIQENCRFDSAGKVTLLKAVTPGDNIRPAGQDIRIGDIVAAKGKRLTAVDLGLIASVGVAELPVFEKLQVAIFSTGDELAMPGQALKPGQIYNSNRPMLMALCEELGLNPVDTGIVEDTLSATKAALQNAAQSADVIISSGGVSVGDEDHIRPALEALGELQHWKVQMKPGKPVVLGNIEGTPFIGLPGNPVSSFVVFQLLAIPLLETLQGSRARALSGFKMPTNFDKAAVSREEFIRVQINRDAGAPTLELFDNQSSGVLCSLAWADGLVRQHVGQTITQGDAVEFLPLQRGVL